jgi:carbamoyl-phosphate synthase small subunit
VEQTYLVLADGSCYKGLGIGCVAPDATQLATLDITDAPCGEVVFNTTMGAYHEILTDPSYAGQMVAMTCPHIGNYGMDTDWNEMAATIPYCRGLIVRDAYEGPVPPGRMPFSEQLVQWGMCAITEVDTRSLTIHLRDHGACYGVLVRSSCLGDAISKEAMKELQSIVDWLDRCPPMSERDFIDQVGIKSNKLHLPPNNKGLRFALIDYGVKQSIIKALLKRGIEVLEVPATTTAEEILALKPHVDAVFLSNGPGDPAVLNQEVAQISRLIGRLPILGICLGHQLIARAIGGTTIKHTFGHHGGNHPVRELQTGRVFVTAQNHGYCVQSQSLPAETEIWFVNANDGTLEGMYDDFRKVMSVQFHPEAAPGPREASYIFDRFITFTQTAGIQE